MLRSLVLLTLLTLTWGFNWSVLKIGATQLPPLWFRSLGLVLGTAVLGVVLAVRGTSLRLPRGAAPRILLLAFPNVIIWYAVVTVAIKMLPAGRAAILGFTMPVWSAVIGALFYHERIDRRTAFAVACAAGGIALLVVGDRDALRTHPAGAALMLVAACAWAWGTHLFRRSRLELDTLTVTFWMFAFGCPVVLAASVVFEGAQWRLPVGVEWLPILYNAVLVIGVGSVIWFVVVRALPPTTAGLSSMLIPVVGVFSGMFALGERPTWQDFAALALISAAVVVALLPRSHEPGRT